MGQSPHVPCLGISCSCIIPVASFILNHCELQVVRHLSGPTLFLRLEWDIVHIRSAKRCLSNSTLLCYGLLCFWILVHGA
ncbi:uncharacterized protein C8R40DRAFT_650573 [Lentinula edodes]|uniref:uncharacterized protein n=1 Tax=Lentinula edodes TaxID=5353 RepID=UPI001E8DA9B2|nr:uncharacterized protein C8R40DRAFT_650573 [Lentinula edodes]KAH7870290.1 hypothetical protein C8R40DRAFT_650573 [Lentinula edodes]